MVDLKPAKPKSDRGTAVRRGLSRQQILLLVLASILIHALGLLLFVRYKPSEPTVSEQESLDPIEFTVLPEELAEPEVEAEAAPNPPPAPEPTPIAPPQQLEAEAPPPATPEPTPEPEVVEPEPEPAPEPIEPRESTQAPALSGSDEAISEPEPTPPESNSALDSVATNQPPPAESQPANPDGVSTSASDLLGGDYEKTLASGGDAFFSEEALEHNTVLDPEQLKALKGIDLSQYVAEMHKKTMANWNPRIREGKHTIVLRFDIQKNGQIIGLEVIQSSGSEDIDREVLEAVQKSAPLAPLPSDFPLDNLSMYGSFTPGYILKK